ncbi:two-component sensor histidine kinase [Rhodobacter veldkampii DSM 11550]|uniref:histidine kinase n=1 Tax=Phaeovulum veldkampii DSM 11550 TaxID=1185920 RepID=A0A2T4JJJ6_9RHOB|nr:ATP-binding protein [Phaeovulum veldkampii]MBK5945890.1 two-component sensor histidine kinase [Phaeovulum veldkampii DSM 11550]PTE18074.1 two-component sensor histidine kinase [Phaeovulum veldkampii DSM 11550]TDQ57123.1 two-component system osmolarity sensor histidine kinase EnvZ [Phaeovulum veldkampii DSM 11550]
MDFGWLKRMMPRGLYGRAALILILPVVTIQLVVSVGFLQRHFEDVTRQMTSSMAREVRLVADLVALDAAPAAALARAGAVAGPLALELALPVAPEAGDPRVFYDLSGRVVIATLRQAVAGITLVDLSDLDHVRLVLGTRHGPMQVQFARGRVSASNPHQLLVLMVATGLLMTFIAYVFLRNQLRPIRRLAEAAQEFGKGRVLPYRPGGAAEVRAAGTAFLEMRARIDRQTEQRRLMLSGISHDLRTPLTRLRLGLSILPEDEDVAALERDVDEMGRLIDAFLDFARDAGSEEPAETLDPVEFAAALVEDARRAGQDVTLTGIEGQGRATFRPGDLRRALENLIGNAVRYGGRAEVSVALGPRSLRFTVEDDGPGIPPERRDEALRPFTRLDPARNQNRGQGVGLGLAIAAEIARSHGGQLRLGESTRLGGLKAEVMLPL